MAGITATDPISPSGRSGSRDPDRPLPRRRGKSTRSKSPPSGEPEPEPEPERDDGAEPASEPTAEPNAEPTASEPEEKPARGAFIDIEV